MSLEKTSIQGVDRDGSCLFAKKAESSVVSLFLAKSSIQGVDRDGSFLFAKKAALCLYF